MTVYRLSAGKYKNDLSSKGAELAGGRWNSKGVPMLYTSSSIALCLCELAVHIPFGIIPKDYYLLTIDFPDNAPLTEIQMQLTPPSGRGRGGLPPARSGSGGLGGLGLPKDWRSVPHAHSTQLIGDKFIRDGKYLVMKLPSAVVPGDYNYLMNPAHKDFSKVKIKSAELFEFDSRIFKDR
jgi:RES domain-containing protein